MQSEDWEDFNVRHEWTESIEKQPEEDLVDGVEEKEIFPAFHECNHVIVLFVYIIFITRLQEMKWFATFEY